MKNYWLEGRSQQNSRVLIVLNVHIHQPDMRRSEFLASSERLDAKWAGLQRQLRIGMRWLLVLQVITFLAVVGLYFRPLD